MKLGQIFFRFREICMRIPRRHSKEIFKFSNNTIDCKSSLNTYTPNQFIVYKSQLIIESNKILYYLKCLQSCKSKYGYPSASSS